MKLFHEKRGFTLVELLVVIAIIGLLASVVFVAVSPARVKSRDARRIADMNGLSAAIEFCRDENGGNAPATLTTAATCGTQTLGSYTARIPTDPNTGAAYPYLNGGSNATYCIGFTTEGTTSLGAAGGYVQTSVGIAADASPCATAADER